MFKWNAVNITSIFVVVGIAGGLVFINSSSFFTSNSDDKAPITGTPSAASGGNPLLTAKKDDVSRWFPGTCFAEIYMESSSYGGALVRGCIDKAAKEIHAETGAKLTAEDFRKPEVISHFKSVYGSAPWRS